MSSTFNIEIQVNATVNQEILITKKGVTADDILAGLNDGTYATTLGHDSHNTHSTITDVATGEEIALIVSQESDGEYSQFEYSE